MMIWKYPLDKTGLQCGIAMPAGAKILAVQVQHDVPCLWALVDPALPPENRRFVMVGTGDPFEWDGVTGRYVGTFQLTGGSFVGHLFELPRLEADAPVTSGEEEGRTSTAAGLPNGKPEAQC